jgi:hypothetical protein
MIVLAKKTIKEYLVPFKVEGEFRVRAKDISDLKKKMDGMMIGDLMATSENLMLKADPDSAEKVAEIKEKVNIKYIQNNQK